MNTSFSTMFLVIQRIEGYDKLVVRWWWAVVAIAALMIILATWRITLAVVRWWRRPQSKPNVLFKQLCRLHKLNKGDLEVFNSLKEKLPNGLNAVILFVDPATWQWKQAEDGNADDSVRKLYTKIFGFPPDKAAS